MGSLMLAVSSLTVVPVPGRETPGISALGRAAWWFPIVGALLGGGLALALAGLEALFPPLVAAALLVSAWKAVTGGIHLDGLADVLDGLAGRDTTHRLSIMRDSRIGVFGAAGLVLFLVLVVTAVAELSGPTRGRLLVLAPVVGRVAPLLIAAWLRPATPGKGLGAAFAASLSRWAAPLWGLGGLALGGALLGPWGAAVVAAAWGAAVLWAVVAARRLGGLTGDVLGAVVELAELGVLLAGAAAVRRGLLLARRPCSWCATAAWSARSPAGSSGISTCPCLRSGRPRLLPSRLGCARSRSRRSTAAISSAPVVPPRSWPLRTVSSRSATRPCGSSRWAAGTACPRTISVPWTRRHSRPGCATWAASSSRKARACRIWRRARGPPSRPSWPAPR